MYYINAMPGYIPIGNQRDFGHSIQFDVTAWADLNADDWRITYTRPGESATYPVPDGDVSVVDNVLTWTISEAVTAINGAGSVIIEAYRGGEMLKHSDRVMTIIGAGHEPAGEAPDPVADWISDATSKLAEVDHFVDETIDATEAANDAADRADTIAGTLEGIAPLWANADISVSALGEGAAPTASITQGETGTSISLGIPKGYTGAQGDKGNDGKPFNYRGDYNPDADPLYTKNDVVRFGGGSLVYINDVDSNEPTSSESHWQQIASIGGQDLVDAAVAARDAAQAQAVLAQGYASQLAAGTASPAGTYANLAALNSGTPTAPNTAKIYITLDNGNWCYHNGTTWVAGGVYQATSDHAEIEAARGGETTLGARLDVSDVKLCNIAKTTNRKNLLDQTAITDNTAIGPMTGDLSANSTFYTTDYIPVTPGMVISFQNEATTSYPSRAYDGARYVCCYDQNKAVVTPGFSSSKESIVVPSGVYFIRATLYRSNKTSVRRPSINPCARLVEFTEYGAKKAEPSDAPEIANPARLWSVVNVPFTIYPKNITDADADAVHIAMPSTNGANVVIGDAVTITDEAASAIRRTNFLLYSKRNGAAIKYGASTRTSVAESSSNGTYKVLQIGDSTTAGGGQVTQMLARSAASGEVTQITAVGTKGTAPALHEGLSGWSYKNCVTVATNNPFFNPATSRFDFAYYMNTTGLTGLNAVILALGINDLYLLTDRMDGDVEIDAKIAETIGYALEIIASIAAYDANIKVVVDTVIHGNALASAHVNNQTPWGYKRIVIRYNTALIEAMTPRGYHIAPTFLYLDPASDIADNVHPTAGGYVKLGNVHFDMLKGVLM